MVAEVMDRTGDYSELKLRRALANSNMLSSDVSNAYDPNYAAVSDKKNSAFFGNGMVFNKYTGSRGKSGSNDASAEYLGNLRKIMDDNNVSFFRHQSLVRSMQAAAVLSHIFLQIMV